MPTIVLDGALEGGLPSPAIWLDGVLQPAPGAAPLFFKNAAGAGDTVTPSLVRGPGGESFTPEWSLGDGTVLYGDSVSHTYAASGPGGEWECTLGPAEMLPFVTTLDMNRDKITEALDQVAAKMTNLTQLFLQTNLLSGEIPAELGNLTNLTHLFLHLNQLSGEIPAELGNLTNLVQMLLHLNQLSGEIPAELGNLTNLLTLFLHLNQLSATEPGAYAIPPLRDLWLQDNEMPQVAVDSVITEVYANRASYTYATPSLSVGGTNAAPSGNVVAPPPAGVSNSDWNWNGTGHDPLTGGAKIYDLHFDVRGEGYNAWDPITWTGGAFP